jgi:hypothetical protein
MVGSMKDLLNAVGAFVAFVLFPGLVYITIGYLLAFVL